MTALWREELARLPRWNTAETCAIRGRCRGRLLAGWGEHLARRFGIESVERVQSRLPPSIASVGPAPEARIWVPVAAQILITEAIIDEFLDGDVLALYPLLLEDTRRASSKAALRALRGLGRRGIFRLAGRAFRQAYDVGELDVTTERKSARLRFHGSALFQQPTWMLLQVMAQQVLLELAGSTARVDGVSTTEQAFVVHATW